MKIIPKEIKRRARAALTGYYFPAVSMTISLTLFTTALSLLVSASGLYGSPRPLGQALYWILYGITLLLGALLETGLVRFLYSLNRRQPLRERGALFFAFRSQADSYILAYAFRYLVTLVWFAPALSFYMRIPLVIDPANPPADLAFNAGMTLLLSLAALIPAACSGAALVPDHLCASGPSGYFRSGGPADKPPSDPRTAGPDLPALARLSAPVHPWPRLLRDRLSVDPALLPCSHGGGVSGGERAVCEAGN